MVSAIGTFVLNWLWAKVAAGVAALYLAWKTSQAITNRETTIEKQVEDAKTPEERKNAAKDSLDNL